jgi:hypothetical protein
MAMAVINCKVHGEAMQFVENERDPHETAMGDAGGML